jgi:hypothetical protein
MIEAILQHASRPDGNPYISMTYGQSLNDLHQRYAFQVIGGNANLLPTEKGIYFLLSHQRTRLQKIGMANGKNGLRQRIRDYRVRVNPKHPPADRAPLFWYRVMTGNVQQNEQRMPENYGQIDLYFKSFTQLQRPIIEPFVNGLGINHVDYDPHAVLENMFIEYTVALRGNNNNGNVLFQADEQYPLLLDSKKRIPINQFAPVL